MDEVNFVKKMTEDLCKNNQHEEVFQRDFAPDFTYWTNGEEGNLTDLASRLTSYRETYEHLGISHWDMIFATERGVVVSYIFESKEKGAEMVRTAVMAIWEVKDGRISSLREVLGPSREGNGKVGK